MIFKTSKQVHQHLRHLAATLNPNQAAFCLYIASPASAQPTTSPYATFCLSIIIHFFLYLLPNLARRYGTSMLDPSHSFQFPCLPSDLMFKCANLSNPVSLISLIRTHHQQSVKTFLKKHLVLSLLLQRKRWVVLCNTSEQLNRKTFYYQFAPLYYSPPVET